MRNNLFIFHGIFCHAKISNSHFHVVILVSNRIPIRSPKSTPVPMGFPSPWEFLFPVHASSSGATVRMGVNVLQSTLSRISAFAFVLPTPPLYLTSLVLSADMERHVFFASTPLSICCYSLLWRSIVVRSASDKLPNIMQVI